MAPVLLVLALEFHRTPIRFVHLTDPARPLPEGFGDWLAESSAALGPANIQSTAKALGTEPDALREAFLFLLRQILLAPRTDHYRVLGLSQGCPPELIKRNHGLLVRMSHPDRLPGRDGQGVALTARINAAYRVLRDPETRRRYDSGLSLPPAGGRSSGDDREFFRPRDPVDPSPRRHAIPARLANRVRSLSIWVMVGALVAVLLLLAAEESGPPVLHVSRGHAERPALGPSYLGGTEVQAVGVAGNGFRSLPIESAPPPTENAVRPGREQGRPETPVLDPGPLQAPVESGPATPTPQASAPFPSPRTEAPGSSTTEDQRVLGRGTLRIGTRPGSWAEWRDRVGSVELELVPWMGDYRVSRLIHHLPRN